MRVLHLNTFDTVGGAARAAYRLHEGLCDAGNDSWMLVQKKVSHDKTVLAPNPILGKLFGKARSELNNLTLYPYSKATRSNFSPQWVPNPLLPKIHKLNPDIVNLHWIANGFLQIETLKYLKQPIVWTLHDMWPFTGGCHYTQDCLRYTQTCGSCPQLGSHKVEDLSFRVWQRKANAWRDINLTIVASSHWLAECARSSTLFQNCRVEVIALPLDVSSFKPAGQAKSRELLKLPHDKKLILFGAINATKDYRKGFHLLESALSRLSKIESIRKQVAIVVFGASQPENPVDLGFETYYLGYLRTDTSLALAYSAADVFVSPSLQEAFGQTAAEAMACGTPVVAFEETGTADIVEHQINGYLAKPFNVDDLAQGITWVLTKHSKSSSLRTKAREKAQQNFSSKLQTQRYLDLYDDLLSSFALRR